GLANLVTRYPARGEVNASLRVVDATGCGRSTGITLDITGPQLSGNFGTPSQICGNGDAQLDPGEHWRLPFTLDNGGDAADDVLALFGKRALGDALQGGPDAFGYTFQDSSQPLCGYQFIDLDGLVDELELIPAGEGFPSNDDGRSAMLPLGDFAFEAYGQLISALSMSTNGYLSADPNITGGDFSSTCGVDPDEDAGAFRSNVLHDDLISAGGLRHATFEVCPRPADVGPANQRCAVFQWSGMGRFTSGGNPNGDVSFQAVVYPDSRQIVHQYAGDLPGSNDDADISLYRGPGQARLSYSCDTAVPLDQRAVCFFHPDNQPGAADPAGLRLITPTLALDSIGAAATAMGNVEFQVPADTACGSRYQLHYRGSTYAGGFEPGSAMFDIDVADSDVCEVVTSCDLDPPAAIDLNDGAFFDPRRPGNGLVSHVIPRGQPGAAPEFFALWFTGEQDRQSSWLVIQGELIDGQVSAPILRFVRDVDSPSWSVSSSEVGQAEVRLLDANQLVLSWRFDGPWQAERMTQLFAASGAAAGNPDRTGAWFHPPESGWGLTVDSFRLDNVEQDFNLVYIYDAAGQPRWSLVQALANDNGVVPALVGQVHCPGCAWLDIDPTLQVAGTAQRRFPSSTEGVISINLSLPPPLVGDWQRTELPINILTLPRPDTPPTD
ncbi:MAG: hypothetical protein KDI56_10930, partial [Xanthomonadales bacterium]|nr:hypothetical protein [Xanthomonadales bacterium]